ncbi:MAG: hypothetical protein V1748_13375 [Actinomycetota bacterium]
MVRGLAKFREQFRLHSSQYVLIGGAACDLHMEEAGLEFRATKDLDIVLSVEALDASFVRAFWAFVRAGGYQIQETTTGERRYYRFLRPEDEQYPYMLELFARRPDMLDLAEGAHITPVRLDEEISSLSAILLDDSYYAFLHSGIIIIQDMPVVDPEHLIPLKARAWLDLTRRKEAGEAIDAKSIAKHKNDVFRLYRVIAPDAETSIPKGIRDDMRAFLDAMVSEKVDLKNLGIKGQDPDSILAELRSMYVNE